jgi:hypothetical protein
MNVNNSKIKKKFSKTVKKSKKSPNTAEDSYVDNNQPVPHYIEVKINRKKILKKGKRNKAMKKLESSP